MNSEQLIENSEALIDLSDRGALVPENVGGHAKTLLQGFIENTKELTASLLSAQAEIEALQFRDSVWNAQVTKLEIEAQQAQADNARLRENLNWIAEFGKRESVKQAIRNNEINTLEAYFGGLVHCAKEALAIESPSTALQEYRYMKADAERFRWLTADHADREIRQKCRDILERMGAMSYSAACISIDAIRDLKHD